MKIIHPTPKPKQMKLQDIPCGTVFRANGFSGNESLYFLRGYDCIIRLDDPSFTWTLAVSGNALATNYHPVKVYLVIEEE